MRPPSTPHWGDDIDMLVGLTLCLLVQFPKMLEPWPPIVLHTGCLSTGGHLTMMMMTMTLVPDGQTGHDDGDDGENE
jgi:hypothetical protein